MVNYFVSILEYFYRMELARRLRGRNLIQTSEEETDARIEEFHRVYKILFLEAVLWQLDLAFHFDYPVFLAFDAFNVASDCDIEKRIKCINGRNFMVNRNNLLSTMKLMFPIPSLIKLKLMMASSHAFSPLFLPKLNVKENYTTRKFMNLFKKRNSNHKTSISLENKIQSHQNLCMQV